MRVSSLTKAVTWMRTGRDMCTEQQITPYFLSSLAKNISKVEKRHRQLAKRAISGI